MDLHIRTATFEDLPPIYDLVKDLAIYENAEEEVTATLEDYQADFQKNHFEALLATSNGIIVGMMLYYMTYSTWKGKMLYLEDFIVKEEFRNAGVGQQLYDAFLKVAKDKNTRMVKWQVLNWNTPAVNFYKKNNAIIEKNWWNVKIIFNN